MEFTLDHVFAQIDFLYDAIARPYYDDVELLQLHREFTRSGVQADVANGLSPADAAHARVHQWALMLAAQSGQLPVTPEVSFATWSAGYPYLETLETRQLVELMYPQHDLAEREGVIAAITLGSITNTAFFLAYLIEGQSDPTPSLASIVRSIQAYDLEPIHLPKPPSLFEHLSKLQIDYLVANYVVAFGRGPEHEGLTYWAEQLEMLLKSSVPEPAALRTISRDIYWAGLQHEEAGTQLDLSEYIEFVYTNARARPPHPDELSTWLTQLEINLSTPDELLNHLIVAALDATGPHTPLLPRLLVAKHMASLMHRQPELDLDTHAILSAVDTPGDALVTIAHLLAQHGHPGFNVTQQATSSTLNDDHTGLDHEPIILAAPELDQLAPDLSSANSAFTDFFSHDSSAGHQSLAFTHLTPPSLMAGTQLGYNNMFPTWVETPASPALVTSPLCDWAAPQEQACCAAALAPTALDFWLI